MSEELSNEERIALVSENLPIIRSEIGRINDKCRILAATKTVPVEVINYAIDNLGLCDIGENRVQELLEKYDFLHKENVNIHFIGRLQTNKVKYIIDKVTLIHSVDSMKLALEINQQAEKIGRVMDVLIEVNVGGEESKGGIPPLEVNAFADAINSLKNLRLAGIMSIPPASSTAEDYRKYFEQTYEIFVDISKNKLHNINGGVLSMGMSDSYMEAVGCGSNLVRLGRVLFGKRNYAAIEEK